MISFFANTLCPPVNKLFLSFTKFSLYIYFPKYFLLKACAHDLRLAPPRATQQGFKCRTSSSSRGTWFPIVLIHVLSVYLCVHIFMLTCTLLAFVIYFYFELRNDLSSSRLFSSKLNCYTYIVSTCLTFGKKFFVRLWKIFLLEVFYKLSFSRFFLSSKLRKHELQRASICYYISINNQLFKCFKAFQWLKWYFLHMS